MKQKILRFRPFTLLFIALISLVFTSTVYAGGAWVGLWETIGDENSNIFMPVGISVDSNDNVLIVDKFLGTVRKRDSATGTWSPVAGHTFSFSSDNVIGLAVDGSNNIFILNSLHQNNNIVWKYDDLAKVWADVTHNFLFDEPTAITADNDGNVYVSERFNPSTNERVSRILKLSNGSSQWTEIGNWNNGGFVNVTALAVDNTGALFATDYLKFVYPDQSVNYTTYLRKKDKNSATWSSYADAAHRGWKEPNGMVFDNFGNLYISCKITQELNVWANGATDWYQIRYNDNTKFNYMRGVTVDSKGYVYVADAGGFPNTNNQKIYRHQPWASLLSFQVQPGSAQAGFALNPQPAVTLKSLSGEIVKGASTVNMSLGNPQGALLNGNITATFNNGTAIYSNLSVSIPGTYTLTAASNVPNLNIRKLSTLAGQFLSPVALSQQSSSFAITAAPQAPVPTALPSSGTSIPNNSIVNLSCNTPNPIIHYTTDGSIPNSSSPVGSAVTLTGSGGSTITLNAICSSSTTSTSSVASFTYTILPTTYAVIVENGSGEGNFAQGVTVAITANNPEQGMRFKEWLVEEGSITLANSGTASTSFVMPSHSVKIKAIFEAIPYYQVTVNNGMGGGSFAEGAKVTIQAFAMPGNGSFKAWIVEEGSVLLNDIHSSIAFFQMPASSVTITATYLSTPEGSYKVTVHNGMGSGDYLEGYKVNISAAPAAEGMQFKKWIAEEGEPVLDDEHTPCTFFSMPAHSVTVSPVYEALLPDKHTIFLPFITKGDS
ncbi:MAG: chitobiase/beta-hexosaminidase C-terminal domain-containing protein [Anaerolineaceae bacterium]|nr:chitobiase/beta-hexosaminidase C-terminal domain-containing protein [Anaerolineaceae bacterium]